MRRAGLLGEARKAEPSNIPSVARRAFARCVDCARKLRPPFRRTPSIVCLRRSSVMTMMHDHDRRPKPAGTPVRSPERIVPAVAVVVVDVLALGPEVDLIGADLWKRIIVFSDLVLLDAVQAAGDGQVAASDVDGRIIETLAAGDEASVAVIVPVRARIRPEFAREHFKTGGIGARFDVDDFAAPAYTLAAGVLADGLLRRDRREVVTRNRCGHRRAAAEGYR